MSAEIDPLLLALQAGPQPPSSSLSPAPLTRPPTPPPPPATEGPQGDPFAAPPTEFFVPPPPPPAPEPRLKRKRHECHHCRGNKHVNAKGVPEALVVCAECGGGSHPSCTGLEHMVPALTAYAWRCADCTLCEVCGHKEETHMIMCDVCDRGWHTHCIGLDAPPDGKWYCPTCTGVPTGVADADADADAEPLPPHDGTPEIPDAAATLKPARRKSTAPPKRRRTTTGAPSTPRKRRRVDEDDEDDDADDDGAQDPPPRGRGRPRKTDEPRTPRVVLKLGTAKGKERADSSPERDPYADVLDAADRDTSRSRVLPADKARFERARAEAEALLAPPPAADGAPPDPSLPLPARATRSALFAARAPSTALLDGRPASPSAAPAPGADADAGPRIKTVRLGAFDVQCWYDAPFPEEYAALADGRLWLCEFCLKYMRSEFTAARHRLKCKARHPPGDEIYRDGAISIWEVDGRLNKTYCQNLCLLSKMFLDHKSLFYDVEPFLFYVLTELDARGAQFVGYFSKEKRRPNAWNLSCIMTLPVRQRRGFGAALIDFSYLLSRRERRLGGPERPLSALGAIGYRNYWSLALMRFLDTAPPKPRLEDIARATSMTVEDIYNTLEHLGFIHVDAPAPPPPAPRPRLLPGQSMKSVRRKAPAGLRRTQTTPAPAPALTAPAESTPAPAQTAAPIATSAAGATHGALAPAPGDHGAPAAPFVPPRRYTIAWDAGAVRAALARADAKGHLRIDSARLRWTPFVAARADAAAPPEPGPDGLPAIDGLVLYSRDPTPEPMPPPPPPPVDEEVEEGGGSGAEDDAPAPPVPQRRRSARFGLDAPAPEDEEEPAAPTPRRRASQRHRPDAEPEPEPTPRARRRATETPARSPEAPTARRLRSQPAPPPEDEDAATSPTTRRRPGRPRRSASAAAPVVAQEEEEEEEEAAPVRRQQPRRQSTRRGTAAPEHEDEPPPPPSPASPRTTRASRRAEVVVLEDSEPEPASPRKQRAARRADTVVVPDESDAEPASPRKQRAARRSSRRAGTVDDEAEAEPAPAAPPRTHGRPASRQTPAPPAEVVVLDDSDAEPASPRKQRATRRSSRHAGPADGAEVEPAPVATPRTYGRRASRQTPAPNGTPRALGAPKHSLRSATNGRFTPRVSLAHDKDEPDIISRASVDEDAARGEEEDSEDEGAGRALRSSARTTRASRGRAPRRAGRAPIVEPNPFDDTETRAPRSPRKRLRSSGAPAASDDDADELARPALPLRRTTSGSSGAARKRMRIDDSEPEDEARAGTPDDGRAGTEAIEGELLDDGPAPPESARHSAPSDDTVFVPEHGAGKHSPPATPATPARLGSGSGGHAEDGGLGSDVDAEGDTDDEYNTPGLA